VERFHFCLAVEAYLFVDMSPKRKEVKKKTTSGGLRMLDDCIKNEIQDRLSYQVLKDSDDQLVYLVFFVVETMTK